MKQHSLLWGAALLLICNFISKILGFMYRIVLVRIIGTEGIGLTEMVTPIYSFCLVIASFGVPLALTKLLANEFGRGRYNNIAKIWHTCQTLLIIGGIITTIATFVLSPWLISHFVIDSRTMLCFQVLVPAIFMVTICSGYRGYFQATKQIAIIGVSQNIEQVIRVVVGVFVTTLLMPMGLEIAIIGISIATVLGELCGLLYLYSAYKKSYIINSVPCSLSTRGIIGYIYQIGAPTTIQKIIMSFLLMLQAFIIPFALQKSGLSTSEVTAIYGNFAGVAMALIHLPAIFTATLAMALLPAIAEVEDNKPVLSNRINQSLHINNVISLPFMVIFFLYSTEACVWIFKAPDGAASLQILGLGTMFIYGQTTITSILQGLGNVKELLINLIISGVFLVVGLYVLVPMPAMGISGAAIAFVVFAFVNCWLNLAAVVRKHQVKLDWNLTFFKPLLAAGMGFCTIKITAKFMAAIVVNQYLFVLSQIGLFCLVYLAVLFLVHGLPQLILKYFPSNV